MTALAHRHYSWYNQIINVEDGQFLILNNCTASPIEEMPHLDYRKANHFKVGYHIPAGMYCLQSGESVAYSLSVDDIVVYEYVSQYDGSPITLTVEEGQYLLIYRGTFIDGESIR